MICGATINIWWKRSHCVHQKLLYKQSTYRSYSSLMLLFHQEVASSKVTLSLWPGLRHVLSTRQRGNCQEPNGTRKRGLSVERASWSGGSLWEGKASFLGFDWRRHSIWHILWGIMGIILIYFDMIHIATICDYCVECWMILTCLRIKRDDLGVPWG